MGDRICRVDRCGKPVKAGRTLCSMHAARWARHGDLDTVKRPGGRLPNRPLFELIEFRDGCWIWTGSLNNKGYGRILSYGYAHRFMYERWKGPIPAGLELDHLCRKPACCNPDHLEAVTHSVNMQRAHTRNQNTDKTHCPQGHPYDDANTYGTPAGGRQCRECGRAQSRRYHQERRASATA